MSWLRSWSTVWRARVDIDGAFVLGDALRLLLFFGALALAFWTGRAYETLKREMEEEW